MIDLPINYYIICQGVSLASIEHLNAKNHRLNQTRSSWQSSTRAPPLSKSSD